MSRRFPGPISSFGEIISEVTHDGSTETIEIDDELIEVSMRGWSQLITVEKVDPYDYSVVVPRSTYENVAGGRRVDQYPLKVTVTVVYDGAWNDHAPPMSQITWVVPPR